jgi:hypothetical protein
MFSCQISFYTNDLGFDNLNMPFRCRRTYKKDKNFVWQPDID